MFAALIILPPFLGFFDDELAEVGGRTRKRAATRVRKLALEVGIRQASTDHDIELIKYAISSGNAPRSAGDTAIAIGTSPTKSIGTKSFALKGRLG
jgi:hypothetical protein